MIADLLIQDIIAVLSDDLWFERNLAEFKNICDTTR